MMSLGCYFRYYPLLGMAWESTLIRTFATRSALGIVASRQTGNVEGMGVHGKKQVGGWMVLELSCAYFISSYLAVAP